MKLGIVSSMPIETELILSKCVKVKEIMIKRNVFYQGKFGDYELIVVATGVGKTNAAIFTQILIDNFQPEAIINIGVGGSLSDKLETFDVVLGTTFTHHDIRIEQMKNTFPFRGHFKANYLLIEAFSKYITEDRRGKIVSGEAFIDDPKKKFKISNDFPQSLIVDMETCSMAQCAYLNDVPFISLTAVTDYADSDAREVYYSNDKKAADAAGKQLLHILKEEKIVL